jgi:O-succinylbenzoate synthase
VTVECVTLHRVALPLLAPHVAAHGAEDRREVVLVSVADEEGVVGWGECPALSRPGYSSEWTEGAWWVLRRVLVPRLLHEQVAADLVGHPMAVGAVRDALHDLELRRAGTGAASVLGVARRVPFGVAVGFADDVGGVVAGAEAAVAAGASLVVVKVRPGWSVAPVQAVMDACPGVGVAADANGSFGLADVAELKELDRLRLDFVEQPASPDDLPTSADMARLLTTPLALDEAVSSPSELACALAVGAGSVLTLKPSRLGGIQRTIEAAARARAAGWRLHVGGMLESGVGRAVARLVAARADVPGAGMVGPTSLLFADDVVEPVEADADGTVAVPDGIGLVPSPDPDRLAALTVERWELTRTGAAG